MNEVFRDTLTSEQFQQSQLILRFSGFVVRAEVDLQLPNEFFPIVQPSRQVIELSGKTRFKPLEGLTAEVG